MLDRLVIRDFAVARSVVIEPGPGLNVFTGETGAGKSLAVDALAFLFGGRRGREIIATGAERACVEATLSLAGRTIVIERTISLAGRSSARIDGEMATLEQLRELGARAVDIHGQSEQLSILRPAVQLAALDDFAALGGKREEVAGLVREIRGIRRQALLLETGVRERERLIDQLRFEAEEIAEAGLQPGEDTALREEVTRLASLGRLIEASEAACAALEQSPTPEVVQAVSEIARNDPGAALLAELAASLEANGSELLRELRRYREGLEEDPERLDYAQERLDRIARLCRKYGDSVAEVIAYGVEAEAKLAALTDAGSSLEGLRGREAELLARLAERAAALSRARRASAGSLVHAIAAELRHLGMGNAALSVGFACDDDPDGPLCALPDYEIVLTESPLAGEGEAHRCAFTETGVDRIEFLASFNPGESPRPLSAVASGGETSRFLLALAAVLGSTAGRRLVVLDEADEGVGGRAGALVGEALLRLASGHQVLCITHLPQVAAFGQSHFVVSKQTDGARTWSEVRRIDGEERVAELADMLGGDTGANRAAARALFPG